jgi:NADH:ubiquinone oxidoreductase subunit 6 (subunit J)
MKKRKLKPFVKISLLLVVLLVCSIGISTLINNKTKTVSKQNDDFTYVNDYIFDNYYPVVNQDEKIVFPFIFLMK